MPPHYRDLFVWRKGMDLARLAYLLATRLGPAESAIADDLRTSALAVPTRIAAGHWSDQLARYIRAIDTANARIARVECLLEVAEQLEVICADDPDVVKMRALCAEISRMLAVLMQTLRLRDSDRPAE